MKALLICSRTPAISWYADSAIAANRLWCDRHGYGLLCEDDEQKIIKGLEGRASYWYYFCMLKELFLKSDAEWFVKVDCDVIAVNHEKSLDMWLSDPSDLIYSTDLGPDIINAGVQLIRNNEVNRKFYQQVWDSAERVARGKYKTELWHEQTMLSAAIALRGDGGPTIRIVPHSSPDSFDCFEQDQMDRCVLFHDIAKQRIAGLASKLLGTPAPAHEAAGIAVVYYAYCVNDWQALARAQMGRLEACGLLREAKQVWIVSSGPPEAGKWLQDTFQGPNIRYEHHTDNLYEYYALCKVKELGATGDWRLLYFHTKGVSNIWVDTLTGAVSDLKVKGCFGWRLYMEYFLLDGWKECVSKLDDHDVVCAHMSSTDNWPWGNFWWTKSAWLRTLVPPVAGADRWYFEAWVGRGHPRFHEFKHFTFTFQTSDWPAWLYDGTDMSKAKMEVVKATWGSVDIQVDECRPALAPSTVKDVTDIVKTHLDADGHGISLAASNEELGGDPCRLVPKVLRVWWTVDGTEIVQTGALEGQRLELRL